MNRFITTLLTMLIYTTLGVSTAYAHGDAAHASKSTAIKKEQKDWGIAGDAKAVTRIVTITMLDTMRFAPDSITVKQGQTLKFVIRNSGSMLHELVIGSKKELEEHAALMLKFPDMQHEEPYMAHVPAGKTEQLIWTFNKAGNFDFACLIAGHFQAGMVGKIAVVARK